MFESIGLYRLTIVILTMLCRIPLYLKTKAGIVQSSNNNKEACADRICPTPAHNI